MYKRPSKLTPVEVVADVFGADIRGHGDNRNVGVNFTDELCCGYTIHLRHDDVHEDEIEMARRNLFASVDGVDAIFLSRVSIPHP